MFYISLYGVCAHICNVFQEIVQEKLSNNKPDYRSIGFLIGNIEDKNPIRHKI